MFGILERIAVFREAAIVVVELVPRGIRELIAVSQETMYHDAARAVGGHHGIVVVRFIVVRHRRCVHGLCRVRCAP